MILHWRARFPHYRRHLDPILAELESRGVELIEGSGPVTLVAGLPDAAHTDRAILVEHGAGQTYVRGGMRLDPSGSPVPVLNVELYLAPSQRMADFMASKLPNAHRVAVGSPAAEHLNPTRGNRIVFAVHWPSPIGVVEARSSWPWSARILSALVDEYGERAIAHCHPRMAHRFARELKRNHLDPDMFCEDWSEACQRIGVLVCDNSSIVWEANAWGIPVVLMDPPFWNADAGHGLRWGPEAEAMPHVVSPDQAVEAVAAVGEVEPVKVYERIEGSTAFAADTIMEWMDGHC